MREADKTKKQLIAELMEARQQLAELEGAKAMRRQAEEKADHLNLILRAIRNVNQLIARENDRDRLLKGICQTLIRARGYYNAWIALLDESGMLVTYAEAGLGREFASMAEWLKLGKLTDCGRQALQQPGVAVVKDPASTCAGCPLSGYYGGRAGVATRLEHEGRVYGLLCASMPPVFIKAEETALLQEVADDIAFALHNLEMEEQRRQAEEALRESEERWYSIFNQAPIGIGIVTSDGRVLVANKAHRAIIGYSLEELKAMNLADTYENPGDRERMLKLLEKHGSVTNYAARLKRKDGTLVDVLLNISRTHYKGEEVLQTTIIDITERRQAEEQAREAETLRELDKLRTELLANISHELRTPLASIKGFATMLLDYDRRLKRKEKREYLETIDDNTDRLAELVEQLLEMSRLGAGLLSLDKKPATINKLCQHVVAEAQVRSPTHRIVLDLPRRLPRVNIDAKRIHQVLDNLVDNSVKYSQAGTEVTIAVRRTGRELLVSVADQGIGIPKKDLLRVFERMFRSRRGLIPGEGGAGLGLSICKGLVEVHGGRIWMESEEGKGTKCCFTLPIYTRPGKSHDSKK